MSTQSYAADDQEPSPSFTGYWIPKELSELGLIKVEQMLLALIDSLTKPAPDFCFASNAYLAKHMELSEARVSFYLTKFRRMGLIEIVSFDGRRRRMRTLKSQWYKLAEDKQVEKLNTPPEVSKKELCAPTRRQGTCGRVGRVRVDAYHIIKDIEKTDSSYCEPPMPASPSPAAGNNNPSFQANPKEAEEPAKPEPVATPSPEPVAKPTPEPLPKLATAPEPAVASNPVKPPAIPRNPQTPPKKPKPKLYPCLDRCFDLSDPQKARFLAFPEPLVESIVEYCYHPTTEIDGGPVGRLKLMQHIAKNPDDYKDTLEDVGKPKEKKLSAKEKLLSGFKRGEFYNGYEFIQDNIGVGFFPRHGNGHSVRWDSRQFNAEFLALLDKLGIQKP